MVDNILEVAVKSNLDYTNPIIIENNESQNQYFSGLSTSLVQD